MRWWLLVLVASVAFVFQQGDVTVSDGASMFAVDQAVVHHGTLSVPRAFGVPGRSGRYFSKYGVGLPLVALAPVALAATAGSVVGHSETLEKAAAASTMPLIAAGLALAMFLLAIRLGAAQSGAVVVALGAVFGTFMLPYAKDFFAEPLTALALTMAFERTLARKPWQAGAWLALAFLARPQTLLAAPLVIAVVLYRYGRRAALKCLIPLLAAGTASAEYNYYRFGSVTKFGYQYAPEFAGSFLHHSTGLLFNSQKSIFLFAPIVLALPFALSSLYRRDRLAASLLLGNLATTFVITALWFWWQGGWSWGPRLLLPGVLPALAAIGPWVAAPRRLTTVVALFVCGFAVSASTLLVPTQAQELVRPLPRNGPRIIEQYRLVSTVVSYSRGHLYDPVTPGTGSHRRYLSLWQVGASREFGRAGLVAALAGTMVLCCVAVLSARRLVRALGSGTTA